MSRPIKFFFTCPNCEHEQEVSVIPGTDDIIGGPPEACEMGSAAEIDSGGTCEKCGVEFAEDALVEKAYEIARDRAERADEMD